MRCLREVAALGDGLAVAVKRDDALRQLKGEGDPLVPREQRRATLAALARVDWVGPFSEATLARLVEPARQ